MQRGKLVIVAIVGTALVLAGYAWWHRYQQGRRSLALWGAANAQLIRHAPRVELLTLGEGDTSAKGSSLKIDGRLVSVLKRADVSSEPGLIHARHVFIEDSNFNWSASDSDCRGDWSYALRFSNGDESIHLALDLKCGRAYLVESQADGRLIKRVREALAKYLDDHFEK
jgi:hypothetical protein